MQVNQKSPTDSKTWEWVLSAKSTKPRLVQCLQE